MYIPKRFKLLGQTINVEFNNTRTDDMNALGMAKDSTNQIVLSSVHNVNQLPEESIEATFYHELTHQILYKMNEYELSKNEKFVGTFSGLLHQALKTFEYDQKDLEFINKI